jgi:hypothetical protein
MSSQLGPTTLAGAQLAARAGQSWPALSSQLGWVTMAGARRAIQHLGESRAATFLHTTRLPAETDPAADKTTAAGKCRQSLAVPCRDHIPYVTDPPHHCKIPFSVPPIGIDCGCPPLRGLFFDFGQRVVALRLKD